MSENEDLAIFLAQLEALKAALSQGTTVFLTSDSAPWHLLNEANQVGSGHIPRPPDELSQDMPAPPASARRGS